MTAFLLPFCPLDLENRMTVCMGYPAMTSQGLTPAAPQPRQNEKPAATKISGKEILEAIRLMDADERRELTRALFA